MTTAPPLLPRQRPAPFDRWRERIAADPRRNRLYAWAVPAAITLIAGLLRFWNLGHPRAIVFDETYYIKDSWSQWVLGFPAQWPEGADELFLGGDTGAFETSGSFVVHPPLGRFFIGAGMALFGPDSSAGWRFAVAVFGTATVLLVYLVARTLTRSIVFAGVASGLLAIDGLSIVLSRIALLDGILTFFVLLGFWFLLLDRRRHIERLAALAAARTADRGTGAWGPVLWNRPWLIAAGAALGAATAVKWSGLYVLAAFGIWVVVTDALARRRAGVGIWPADAAFRQGPVAFLLLVPIAALVYLASWTSWLVSDGGWERHALDDTPAQGFWSWVPLPLQNLWKYHQSIYNFHVGLTTPHSYQSPAWQWPFLTRPTSMYWHQGDAGVEAVSSIPNPLIWWAGVAAVVFLLVRFALTLQWRYAAVLTGILALYVPWLLYPERTIFQFYTVALMPFLVLAVTFALREIVGGADAAPARRAAGQSSVIVFLVVVTLVSAFWYPVWTGITVPYDFWRLHNWLPTWI
ncbi:dolichyl-phosphate-mannose--protein mannosyltransferase [Microbacterium sp. P06]|uniref:dolichyl-phosphate-mannose--protein mannosyltransferase n=1 Tax=Microbacterium sp. P06 TaxID=3366949 RepID=UPI0037454C12